MSKEIIDPLIRTTLIFIVLFLLTRLLGKKQLSQLTFFNYVTGTTIGSLSANIVSNSDKPLRNDIISLAWWCFLTGLIGFLGLKSGTFRKVVDGQPTILIKKGSLDREAFQAAQLNMEDFTMMLREQNIFSVKEVEYAILETDGKLSILKKSDMQNVTKGDMRIQSPGKKYIPAEIIVDGRVIDKNLREYNLNVSWLDHQLKQQKINSYKDILYAEIQNDQTLYIEKKNKR